MIDLSLSERQRSTLAAAVTVLSAVVILAAVGGLVWLLSAFLGRFAHVFLPLAVAGVIALILKPYRDYLVERWNFPPIAALLTIFVLLLLPVVGLLWFFGGLIVEQVTDLVTKAPAWFEQTLQQAKARWPRVLELWEEYELAKYLESNNEEGANALVFALDFIGEGVVSAGAGIFGALGGLFSWAVLPVYVVFFLLFEPTSTKAWANVALPFLKADTRETVTYLVDEFISIIVAFFRGQFVIAFLQGVLYAIGFSLLGLKYGLILGLVLGFLNIIPYLGSIVGLGVAFPLGFFQPGGGLELVIGVAVVFTIVQTIEGYLLTPRIMGNTTGLHSMTIIVAIFFWGSALPGLAGLILAIPLTAFFVVFWRLLSEKYIQELL